MGIIKRICEEIIDQVYRAFYHGENAYVVALPDEVKMHWVFIVHDLTPFPGDHIPLIALPMDPSQLARSTTKWIDIALDYVASGDPEVIDCYLIRWKNQPVSKSCSINYATLQ